MGKGEPIFRVKPIFENLLRSKEESLPPSAKSTASPPRPIIHTPSTVQKGGKTPETGKIVAPKSPTPEAPRLFKAHPIGSPKERTVGLDAKKGLRGID